MKNNHLQCAFHQGHRALVQLVTVALPPPGRAEFLNPGTRSGKRDWGRVGVCGEDVGAAPGGLGQLW